LWFRGGPKNVDYLQVAACPQVIRLVVVKLLVSDSAEAAFVNSQRFLVFAVDVCLYFM